MTTGIRSKVNHLDIGDLNDSDPFVYVSYQNQYGKVIDKDIEQEKLKAFADNKGYLHFTDESLDGHGEYKQIEGEVSYADYIQDPEKLAVLVTDYLIAYSN